MSLGVTRGSICSAVADRTGDDSPDAVVKIKRLINEKGPDFCALADWPFLRDDISFSITTAAYKYSGASYLPQTFKRVMGGFLLDGTTRYDLKEVSIKESYEWLNPDENDGIPEEFCITRVESDYWQIQFNRIPSNTFTVYLEIEKQWVDLTDSNLESIVTKDYFGAFSHFISIDRFIQQGDSDNILMMEAKWTNGNKTGVLDRLIAKLASPLRKKSVQVDMGFTGEGRPDFCDYQKGYNQ
jgi:hypothetical protein